MMKRICIIANPGSGDSNAADERSVIERAIRDEGGCCDFRVADKNNDLSTLARAASAEGFDVIAAAGGDGSINAIASALVGTDTTLGVIPAGTFNYVGRALGAPNDPEEAARLLVSGRSRPLAAGFVNGKLFLNNASLGAYPIILKHREAVYRRWGRSRLAANWSVLQALTAANPCMRATVQTNDGPTELRTPFLFVALNTFQLARFHLDGATHIDAGRFAVFAAPEASRLKLLSLAAKLAAGVLRQNEDFTLFGAQTLTVETDRRERLVARDGERALERTPFHFELRPASLRVIGP